MVRNQHRSVDSDEMQAQLVHAKLKAAQLQLDWDEDKLAVRKLHQEKGWKVPFHRSR